VEISGQRSEKPIKVGIIGLGRSGRDLHARTLEAHPGYDIVAVSDAIEERLLDAREKWGCRVYRDHIELAGDEEVELVVVATPSESHCRISLDVLGQGKSTVVEKPMALSVEEADRMIGKAEKSGTLLTVFQNMRFDPDFLELRQVIESGILGPIQFIRRGVYSYCRRTDWQALKKYGGGMLNNWGVHLIDQALILLDYKVEEIFSDLRLTVSAGDAEDQVKIILRGKEFLFDIEITSCCTYHQPDWLVMGKYGTLVADARKLRLKYCDPAHLPALPKLEEIAPFSDYRYPSEEITWKEEEREISGCEDPSKIFYDRLYATLREGQPLAIKPEEVRMVLEVIESCKRGT